jgi:putative peptide zinc metalloprotease protein
MNKRLYDAGRQRLEQDIPPDPSGLWQRAELRLMVRDEADPLWPRLEDRLAATRSYPRLHPGLVLKAGPADGGPAYLLSDPARGRYFCLGEREAALIPLLDGQREVREVARDYADRFETISVSAVERFLDDLRQAGLLNERASLWQRLSATQRSGPLILWTLPGAADKLAALHRAARFLFTPLSGLVFLLLPAGLWLLAVHFPTLGADLAVLRTARWAAPLLLLLAYLAMVPIVVTHELAHALACIHGGGQVARFGLMLKHLLPAAFADVSDVWTLPRQARIGVFWAGPASTVLWAATSTALWAWTPAGSWAHLGLAAVMLVIWYSLLVGLIPVAGYDGSEVLAEWLRMPNLHRRALGLFRGDRTQLAAAPPRERRILWGYAAGFLVYNMAVMALIVFVVWSVVRGGA